MDVKDKSVSILFPVVQTVIEVESISCLLFDRTASNKTGDWPSNTSEVNVELNQNAAAC